MRSTDIDVYHTPHTSQEIGWTVVQSLGWDSLCSRPGFLRWNVNCSDNKTEEAYSELHHGGNPSLCYLWLPRPALSNSWIINLKKKRSGQEPIRMRARYPGKDNGLVVSVKLTNRETPASLASVWPDGGQGWWLRGQTGTSPSRSSDLISDGWEERRDQWAGAVRCCSWPVVL